uniref:Uncharacterized protein AlNc14C201G8704 n=1 Tax=Albugo laibachii Nc14 TaxID=890382 RepID=F0WQP3_9STRA|nr:conserved hypothetical protein [Albugo laibachii Nc14]|eukprot:CCA23652.1 conserved hypothetical protein [Albugo laibachii Nc14]
MSIKNILIVAHSTGNLVVANAEVKGFCVLAPKSKWIAMAAPMRGSYFADRGMDICAGKGKRLKVVHKSIKGFFETIKQCPLPESKKSLVRKGSLYSDKFLNKAYENAERVYMEKVSSILCGSSIVGLMSRRAMKYTSLSLLAPVFKGVSDGSVSFSSCRAGFSAERFEGSWKDSRFYLARLNHADFKFVRSVNGKWGDDRKPMK